jgi:hypothetical protein
MIVAADYLIEFFIYFLINFRPRCCYVKFFSKLKFLLFFLNLISNHRFCV